MLVAAACGQKSGAPEGDGAPAAGARGPAAALAVAVDWQDPEPPDAQARAEAVLNADWNRDKKTSVAPAGTSRLQMAMTTFATHTTGLQGASTGLAAAKTSLDERLTRLGAKVTETEVTIRLPGSVLFDFDSAAIRPDAEHALTEVAEVIQGYSKRPARVEGHTDSVASDEYNLKLSGQRAEAVSAWLAAHGVEKARLSAMGRGETQPVADNATPQGRQLNRRVEIVIAKRD